MSMSTQVSNAGAKAELIGTFVEGVCYGVYCTVFLQCLTILRAKHLENKPVLVLATTAVCIFVLVSIHFIMDLLRAVQAYTSDMEVPFSAVFYYTIVRRDLDLIKSGCYIAVTIVSDGLICYRTFIVYGSNYLYALIPFGLVLADVGLGVYAVFLLSQVIPGDNALMSMVTQRVKYFYAVTLALNLLCTLMISYKIWRVSGEVDRYTNTTGLLRPNKTGSRLALIIIESAAVYSVMLIILIATSATNAVGMLALLNVIAPVIGIVFSMVIIRFSVDRTRWASIKLSTILNFVPETGNGAFSSGSKGGEVELESASALSEFPSTPLGKLTLANHVRSTSGGTLGLDAGSVFSMSRTSLPDSYV